MTLDKARSGPSAATPALLWRSSRIAFKQRNYATAAAHFQQIISDFGEAAAPAPAEELRLLLGIALLRLGQTAEGVEHLQRAVTLNPQVPRAHYKLGLGLARLKRHTEALEELLQASAAEPERTEYLARLASQYARMNMSVEARAAYSRVLRLDPDHAGARDALAAGMP